MDKQENFDGLFVYAVYDKKANKYDIPFFAASDLFARRRFLLMANDQGTILNQFLKDFDLHLVGSFDVHSGICTNMEKTVVEGLQIIQQIKKNEQIQLGGNNK